MGEHQQSVRKNEILIYVINFFAGLVFWYGIEKVFLLKELQLSPNIIAYIIIVYGLVQIFFNIPTGALADKWSRKGMIVVSFAVLFVSTCILGTSHSQTQYLIGTFGWGVYLVCITGTLESLLYDGLKERGEAKKYRTVYGRAEAIFLFAVFLSSVAGGFISQRYGLRTTYYLTMINTLIAGVLSLFLVEPLIHKHHSGADALSHMISAVSMLVKSKLLLQITIMSTVLFLVQTAFFEYAQLFYIALFGASAIATGIANGFGSLSMTVGNLLPNHIKVHGDGFVILGALLFIAMSPRMPTAIAIVVFMLFGVMYGAISANVNALKHSKLPSTSRATLTSAISTVDYIIVIPLALLFSHLISRYSIFWGYRLVAVLAIAYGIYYFISGRRLIVDDKTKSKDNYLEDLSQHAVK